MTKAQQVTFATIPARRDGVEALVEALNQVPVNDETRADESTAQSIRKHLLRTHKRDQLLSAKESA